MTTRQIAEQIVAWDREALRDPQQWGRRVGRGYPASLWTACGLMVRDDVPRCLLVDAICTAREHLHRRSDWYVSAMLDRCLSILRCERRAA